MRSSVPAFRAAAGVVIVIGAALSGSCSLAPEARMAKHLTKGKQLFEARDFRRAILEFKSAVASQPNQPEPHYLLGLAYLEAGDGASALAELRRTTDLNPNHAGANAKLATLMVATRDPALIQNGETLARQALAANPGSTQALSAMALAELKTGKPEDAEKHLGKILASFPGDLKAAANLASIKLGRKDLPGAEDVLRKAAAAMPKSSKPRIALGRLYLVMGRLDDAETEFRAALSLDEKDAVGMRDLAELLNLRGKASAAEEVYQKLSALPYRASKPLYAQFLFRNGKRDRAIAQFEALAAKDPENRELRSYLVAAYLAEGRRADARKVITAALQKNPRDSDALLQRSLIQIEDGSYDAAEADASAVLRVKDDSAAAHYALAKVHQARGNSARRRAELGAALRTAPGLLEARLELNQALNEANDPKAAMAILDQAPADQKAAVGYTVSRNWTLMALENWSELRKGIDQGLKSAETPDLLLQDGMLRVHERDFERARKSLERALEQNPEDVRALKVLAGIYVLQNQKGAALQMAQERARQRPNSSVLQNYLGQSLLSEGRTAAAKSAFLAAKAADPRSLTADFSLAQAELAEGNRDGARQRLEAARAQAPGDRRVLLSLATLSQAEGRVAEAVAGYRAVLQIDKGDVIALNNLAYLLSELPGQVDEALALAQRAKELAPADPLVADTLGWILVQKKMYGAAVEQLQGAVAVRPVASIHYHLGMAYLLLGDRTRSRENLSAALKLDPNMQDAQSALLEVQRLERR